MELRSLEGPLRIGPLAVDPPILQAPMAGFTNFAFRRIVREFGGAGLLATEMISAEGFVRQVGGVKGSPERLWGVKDEPRPLAVQMWDNDPGKLAEVGRALAFDYGVSVVDLNFGCPVKKITHAHSGSYLLSAPARMHAIIQRVVQACAPVPVTAKIRLGCTRRCVTAFEVARAAEEAGAAALTVHGRVAEDFFSGAADWDKIAEIKQRAHGMPVIGNGDLDRPEKVRDAFARYGVDGVMIARAALGKPWLFRDAAALLRGEPVAPEPSLEKQRELLLRHQREIVARFGEARGNVLMRRFAVNYAQAKHGARAFRTLVSKVKTTEEFLHVVETSFPASVPASGKEPCRIS